MQKADLRPSSWLTKSAIQIQIRRDNLGSVLGTVQEMVGHLHGGSCKCGVTFLQDHPQ